MTTKHQCELVCSFGGSVTLETPDQVPAAIDLARKVAVLYHRGSIQPIDLFFAVVATPRANVQAVLRPLGIYWGTVAAAVTLVMRPGTAKQRRHLRLSSVAREIIGEAGYVADYYGRSNRLAEDILQAFSTPVMTDKNMLAVLKHLGVTQAQLCVPPPPS